ncbi:MAG: sugar phosphate nucleotidyltransferase [Chitinophagaceae bacterium]
MKAMIFAAGLGTRLKPWTLQHPKALAPVNGKSLLQRNILYLQQFGITQVLVNVHHFANQIIDTITENKGWGSNITISDESNEVLETGGGLKKAAWYFKEEESFLVMNADMLTNLSINQLINAHKADNNRLATLAVTNRNSSRSLVFNSETHYLCGWQNNQNGEQKGPILYQPQIAVITKAFSGIQIINNAIFNEVPEANKFGIIDWYLQLANKHAIGYFDHSNDLLLDVGKPESLAKAAELFP